MKKISLLILLICFVFSLLTVFSLAEGEVPPSDAVNVAENEKTATWSESISAWIGDNIDSIFTGASLGGVAILMYLFKKGLLPMVGAAFGKITETVKDAKEGLDKVAEDAAGELRGFIERFKPVLEKIEAQSSMIEKAMDEINNLKTEREVVAASYEETSALLISMIEGSRLPESVKEKARLTKAKQDTYISSLRGKKAEDGGEQ